MNALRQHAKELIVTKADEALSTYEEMLKSARAKHDEAMVRHWTRRIEERKKLIARATKMNRRGLLAGLSAVLFTIRAEAQKPLKKFYVTGLYRTEKLNDCTLPPIECFGTDRLDALTHCGLTVWTEEEWTRVNARRSEWCPKQ